jgi:hypothetical protein
LLTPLFCFFSPFLFSVIDQSILKPDQLSDPSTPQKIRKSKKSEDRENREREAAAEEEQPEEEDDHAEDLKEKISQAILLVNEGIFSLFLPRPPNGHSFSPPTNKKTLTIQLLLSFQQTPLARR